MILDRRRFRRVPWRELDGLDEVDSALVIVGDAERSVPAIRAELVNAEKPLVKEALEAGTARRVSDQALKAEGYSLEVVVESAGERHVFRLNSKGRWCRFSGTICDLDLGADVIAAAKSPAAITKGRLEDTRALMGTVQGELDFLGKVRSEEHTSELQSR